MAISGKVILLKLNQALRAAGSDGTPQDLFKLDSNGKLVLLKMPQVSSDAQDSNDLIRKSQFDSGVDSLSDRLDVIEGIGEGSVAKAEQDAKDYADQKISDLINGSPELLNTLKELADAIDNDPNFAAGIAEQLGLKATKIEHNALADRVTDAEQDISGLDTRLGSAETSLSSKASQSDLSALDTRVGIAEQDIVSIENQLPSFALASDLSGVDGRLVTAEGEIDAIQAELVNLADNSAIQDLQDRLDVIEGAGEGSVAKAEQDAKDYADSVISTEASARESADNALDDRLDSVEDRDLYEQRVVYQDSAAVYADGQAGSQDPSAITRDGWYFENASAGQKINWYFFDGLNQANISLGNFSAFAVVSFDSLSSGPILAVYTVPTGINDIIPGFAHSRKVFSASLTGKTVGKKYVVYFGQNPSVYPGLERIELSISGSSAGEQGASERVLTCSYGSNSGAAVGNVKMMVESLGVSSPSYRGLAELRIKMATKSSHDALAARVTTAESDIAGKASSSVVSGIDGRLVTAEGEIDTLQSDMAGKASQTDLDAAEADIVQLQTDVAAKASQTDLDAAEADIVQLQTDVALKANSSDVSTSLSGKADLVGGKIPQSQIPSIAIVDTFEASSEAAMLALSSAEQGDVCIRSDLNKTFILASGSYGTLANWKELKTPTDAVLSVNGQTGAVSLTKADVGLGNVDNTSDANKPISSAVQTALNQKATTTLSNLGVTSINADLFPSADGARSLGSLSTSWGAIYGGAFYGRTASNLVTFGTQLLSRGATFTNGSADIVLQSSVTVSANRYVWFTQNAVGALPGGISMNQRYYVKTISGSTMTISATSGGAAIVVSSVPGGSYTAWFSQEVSLNSGQYGRLNLGNAAGSEIFVGAANTTTTMQGTTTNMSSLLNMQNHIQPSASNLRDLGSSTKVFRDVYSGAVRLYGADGNFGGSIIGDSTSVGVGAAGGIDFSAGGAVSFSSGTEMNISMPVALNNNTISGVGAPSLSSDAATKGYADAEVLVEKNRALGQEGLLSGRLDTVEALEIPSLEYYSKELAVSADLVSIDVGHTIIGTPMVMIDGVMGRPGVEFTVSGSVITFSGEWLYPTGISAVEIGDKVHVYYMRNVPAFP